MSDDLRRTPFEAASALPVGTRLGEFEVRSVLGIGGFGIVYLAFDHALEREVAVKEYMPASMAGRTQTMHVSLRSQADADVFALGLRSFVNEAKLLARFDHPSLLKVFRFWEANGTAYMAMPVLRGRTLKDIRQGRQSLDNPIDEPWLRGLLDPLLGALDRLHSEGVYHRDIAPDNILIEPDGHPVLLDFGAARRVISDRTQTLTAILKPAYAPIEQYAEAGSVKQGPWTDLYALGATLHYLLLGQPPAPATARAVNEDHEPPLASRKIDGCSAAFLAVIDWMLAPRPGDRPQSVAALQAALAGRAPVPPLRAAAAAPARSDSWEPTAVMPQAAPPTTSPPVKSAPPVQAAAGAAEPPAADDATVVVPPSRPPARPPAAASSAASSAASPTTSRQPSPSVPAAEPPRDRSLAAPIGIGVVALVAVAAFALWPRAADGPSATTPAAVAPPAVTAAAPPPAAVAASAALPATTAPLTVSTTESSSQAVSVPAPLTGPAPTAPTATATVPSPPAAQKVTTSVPATPAAGQRTTGPGSAGTARPPASDAGSPATRAAPTTSPMPAAATQATVQPPATVTPSPAAAAPQGATSGTGTPPAAEAAPATAKPDSPEARCGGRNPVFYFACMERECYRSQFRKHPECLEWHKNARPRDASGN